MRHARGRELEQRARLRTGAAVVWCISWPARELGVVHIAGEEEEVRRRARGEEREEAPARRGVSD